MFGRVIVGSTLASVALMVWGVLFWAVFDIPREVLDPLPNGEQTAAAFGEVLPGTGVYIWPLWKTGTESSGIESLDAATPAQPGESPQLQIFYRQQAIDPMSPTTFARGFLHMFTVSLIAAVLLAVAAPRIESYLHRVGFVLLLGIFAGVAVNLAQPVWFGHPWGYHLVMLLNEAMKGLLLGLVLAGMIRQKPHAGVQL